MELPPLHPILVNFTAALLPVSFVSDVLGRWLRRESLSVAAWWMLCYAAAITPATAIAGWVWLRASDGMDHAEMDIHKWLGTSLVAVFAALAWWRWRYHRAARAPSATYLTLAALVTVLLVYQGHLGGTMSFGTAGPAHVMEGAPPPPKTGEESPRNGHSHGDQLDKSGATRSSTQPTGTDGWSDYIEVR